MHWYTLYENEFFCMHVFDTYLWALGVCWLAWMQGDKVKPPDVLKPYEAADRLKRAYVQVLFLLCAYVAHKASPCAPGAETVLALLSSMICS